MTYFWGDVYSRQYVKGSVVGGKLGSAPTPGVTKVLDPKGSGKLVQCNEEICPYGKTYPDIGRVNLAPFAAGFGWSAAVAKGLSKEREEAMAGFIAFVCGKENSVDDVITGAAGTIVTGADPFRRSHFDINAWVERGYPRETAIQYTQTISESLSSPNTVLDTRFPKGVAVMEAAFVATYPLLVKSETQEITHEERLAVAAEIEAEWLRIVDDYDSNRPMGTLSLKSIYQKSSNVYVEPSNKRTLSVGEVVGLVVGVSVVIISISAMIIVYFRLKMINEEKRLAEERRRAKRRQQREEDDGSDFDDDDDDSKRDEIKEILNASKSETRKILIWRCLFGISLITTFLAWFLVVYPTFQGKELPLSSGAATATFICLFLATAVSFVVYDYNVCQRTGMIVANAAGANAIVTQMFPAQFRDQMLHNEKENKSTESKMEDFLTSGENPHGAKPLADLFLDTTVLFADIAGFTPWSSAREPSQVFTLLESVYFAFDKLAVRRKIFKVETVGDCYGKLGRHTRSFGFDV